MSVRDRIIGPIETSPSGRRILDFVDRLAHPELPSNQAITTVTCNGKRIPILHRRERGDRSTIRQCFRDNQYNMPTDTRRDFPARKYQQILASGRKPLIVDCGANIGTSVVWFATQYPEAHILAVEPAPDNFYFLTKNSAGLDVDLRQAGIAGTDGVSHLVDMGSGGWAYRTSAEASGPEVPMLGICSLLSAEINAGRTLFILKIDVEGAEKTLFDGDCSLINQFPLIIMEPHDWLLQGQGSSTGFFRFHAAFDREFCMNHENVGSMAIGKFENN